MQIALFNDEFFWLLKKIQPNVYIITVFRAMSGISNCSNVLDVKVGNHH